MNPEQLKDLQYRIEQLMDLGYTLEQIENILDLEIHVEKVQVQMVTETCPSNILGLFEINVN